MGVGRASCGNPSNPQLKSGCVLPKVALKNRIRTSPVVDVHGLDGCSTRAPATPKFPPTRKVSHHELGEFANTSGGKLTIRPGLAVFKVTMNVIEMT